MTAALRWLAKAVCRGMDPELFFPVSGTIPHAALLACARCEVRRECLNHTLDIEGGAIRYGIYAGLDPQQRQRLARKRARDRPTG